jgi:hypothetical protein
LKVEGMTDDRCWMTGVSYVTPRNEESPSEELKNAEKLKNVLPQMRTKFKKVKKENIFG